MSILSSGYSSYMSHFHKLQQRITTFNYAFNHVFELAKDGIFIDCNIEERMSDYPKYPCIYRYIESLGAFNILKIYHSSLDTVDTLVDYITSKNALEIKPNLDRIPEDLTKLTNDIYLQYTFFSDVNDLFNLKQHFHDYSALRKLINYSNALSDDVYNELHANHSFIHLFLFDFIFRQQLKNNANYSNALNVYCITNDIFNRQSIIDEFGNFIDANENVFLRNVVSTIIQSLYKMSNTDDHLISAIMERIRPNLETLKLAFENYTTNSTVLPSSEISYYCLNSLYLVFGSKTINEIFNNEDIFDQAYIQTVSNDEDIIFQNFVSTVSSTNLKSYLYLSYLYKFWPVKFVNIYPLIMDKYVEDIVKPDSLLAYPQKNLESIAKHLIAEPILKYGPLTEYFNNNVNTSYLYNLCQEEGVTQFGSFIYFVKLMDGFMESDVYKDFVDNVYHDVFLILRDKGYVDHNFNWCTCKELFNLFFKSFIRSNITSNSIFPNVSSEFENVFYNIINNSTGDPIYDVNISFVETRLKSLYNSMVISHFDKIHGFVESMFLSKLSDIAAYRMLNYFLVDQS